MNLITDQWLPVIRLNDNTDIPNEKITLWQILDNYEDNPVIDIRAPRPDFRNAIYQLIAGIVQVAALPDDDEHWAELFHTPWELQSFKDKLMSIAHCFEIDTEGPAFMQDYALVDGFKEETLGNLFINLPANEHYIPVDKDFRKSEPQQIDVYWAAVALFTLQSFAPSGGRGHRVGLRGGGPLTTLLLPLGEKRTLWEKIWMNIISEKELSRLTGDCSKKELSDIFPWMKPTKVSEKSGSEFFAEECHPFHMYFGMPRRIRLLFDNTGGICDITGEQCEKVVKRYRTRHSGNNYSGTWFHPFTAYGYDPKKPAEVPFSKKPQAGGITYRHWLGLAVKSEQVLPAFVVTLGQDSGYRGEIIKTYGATLWAAGYNMNNMKAECWYESTMPVYPLDSPAAKRISDMATILVNAAQELARSVRYAVKAAWFKSPKDARGDIFFIESLFWQNTEADFYALLSDFVSQMNSSAIKNDVSDRWQKVLTSQTFNLFDQWALAQQEEGLDLKRIVQARNNLNYTIGKVKKVLNNI